MNSDSRQIFAFFPYLTTSDPVRYRGVCFREADEAAGLSESSQNHLETLRDLFYLRDDLPITKPVYAAYDAETSNIPQAHFLQRVQEFRTLLGYHYIAPAPKRGGDPYLSNEHATVYTLSPERVSRFYFESQHDALGKPSPESLPEFDQTDHAAGYIGYVDQKSWFAVHPRSRIYPPVPGLTLNRNQDLSRNFERFSQQASGVLAVSYFENKEELSPLDDRMLTALSWYNRSYSELASEETQLVSLAIAFESLLDLDTESGSVTARFKEAVKLLTPGVPRLDSWLQQFYDARSNIVHQGSSDRLGFVPPTEDEDSADRGIHSLTSYGRSIFRVCLNSMLTGAGLVERMELAPILRTNAERLKELCKILGNEEATPGQRLDQSAQLVKQIRELRYASREEINPKLLVGALTRMAQCYSDIAGGEDTSVTTLASRLADTSASQVYDALDILKDLNDELGSQRIPASSEVPNYRRRVFASFVNVAWRYSHLAYFQLKQAEVASDDGEESSA